ncbi:MAG: ArsA-related P-loop ATPase [Solirubrobacteraceae bacterium]|nr:ArsA-related P-loop ATPase [Solirubrobacteraceae bacterium]
MKIAVAGKGGVGKTTVSGTIARALARSGHTVLALDADLNPMLGVSLGVGGEQTELIVAARQAIAEGEAEHAPTIEEVVDRFGADAPDGVRMVIASRVEYMDPGCMCCGVNPVNLVRQLEHGERTVVCDLEAGIGTIERIEAGVVDVLIVVANPTGKSLEVARRAIEIADGVTEIVVVANRVADDADLELMREVLGDRELFVIPEDAVIAAADRDGLAPIDLDPDSPGVAALVRLAERVAGAPVAA